MPPQFFSVLALVVFAGSFILPSAAAQLVFDSKRVELNAAAEDELISGTFHFRNNGFADEQIVEVESTCGCLSATMDKSTVNSWLRSNTSVVRNKNNIQMTSPK